MVSQLITTPFAPSTAQLRAFEGTYTSDEVHGTYRVVTRDSGLAIQIPGGPTSPSSRCSQTPSADTPLVL